MSTCERCDALIAAARELIRAVEAEVPLLGIPSGDGRFIDLSAWDGCVSPYNGEEFRRDRVTFIHRSLAIREAISELRALFESQPCDSPHSGPSEAPGAVFGDGVRG